jgi:hypothetical protein
MGMVVAKKMMVWMVDDYIYKCKALILFNIQVATTILCTRAIYSYYFCTGLAS